ncbi:putative leucine-rich repeat-containing protein DDB_G0290503 isoform X2 [Calliphora vicina]|uniref:putative leucine-rich repeat-containing protein DDB_G0290503 isoform X2 n=1 Tax=Calliphora vicina TaxID=7373 RepID=UPI00325BF1A8
MKNKYTSEDEMASSCKEMLHCEDRHKRRCNRFTHKKHLRYRTELIALMTLALSLLHYQNKTFVEGMQIISHDLMSEFSTTHIPQLYMDTQIFEESPKLPNSDKNDNEIQSLRESNKDVQYQIKTGDKTNDLQLSTERNDEIKDLSELTSDTTSSKNLDIFKELSEVDNFEKIINENVYSKKAFYQPEFAMEENDEHLELHADGEQMNETISKIYDIKKSNYIEDKFYAFQSVLMKNNNTNYQAEASTNNNKLAIVKKNMSANFEDLSNEVNETKKFDKYKADTTQNYYNNTLRSQTPITIEDTEKVEASKLENILKEVQENVTKDETKEFQTQIKHFNKQNSSLTHFIAEDPPLLTFDSSDFVTQYYDNKYNDILSVDLNETISTPSNNVKETNLLNLEEYSKSYIGETTDESENANNTIIDEELEHVVIKKVLDAQKMFDDPLATTNYPFLQNKLQLTYTDHNDQENDVENRNSDSMYPCTNHTSHIDTLYDSIKTDELMPEYIIVSTGIEENYENISTTDIIEYYQSTDAIDQYENNYFNKTDSEIENVLVMRDSDQNPKQEDTLNSSEHFQNEPEQIADNSKIEVGDSLWTGAKEHVLKVLYLESPPKEDITVIYAKENITAEIDKYMQSMETTEKSESNTNLIQNNQNEHLTDITEMNEDINEQDTNQEITLKNSGNIKHESERFDENNSTIVIADVNKYTKVNEKYESNYTSTTIANEKIEISDLGKISKGPRSGSKHVITIPYDDKAATLFEAYPPRDVGQTFNDNLADESTGIGKALPVSISNGSNRSTIIIIFSCGTAVLFIIISVTIFLISFQRQHGTLDIEMHERNCGKDDLDEEDAQTFAKLLEVELSPSIAVTLEESEECL